MLNHFNFSKWWRPRTLLQIIAWVLLLKLMFVLLMKFGFLGEKQTKGIAMQLPVNAVAKQILIPPSK